MPASATKLFEENFTDGILLDNNPGHWSLYPSGGSITLINQKLVFSNTGNPYGTLNFGIDHTINSTISINNNKTYWWNFTISNFSTPTGSAVFRLQTWLNDYVEVGLFPYTPDPQYSELQLGFQNHATIHLLNFNLDSSEHNVSVVFNDSGIGNVSLYIDNTLEITQQYNINPFNNDRFSYQLFQYNPFGVSNTLILDDIILCDSNPCTPPPGFDPSGYVKNNSGSAIQSATVTLYNSTWSASTTSNSQGYWSISLPASGTYNYVASKTGYAPIAPQSQSFSSGSPTNFTLSPLSIATNPSIKFDKSSYTVGDTMTITTYAPTSGSVQLLNPNGVAKATVPIAAQQTLVSTYHVTQSDVQGLWIANLRDNTNSPVATDNAQVTIPIVPVTTITTGCKTAACSKGEWTVEDVFVWMRIYIPWFTFMIWWLFIIACIGSLKNMIWRPKKKTNGKRIW